MTPQLPGCGSVDTDSLRACMRLFPTGVALLTAGHGENTISMSVNSVVSVSLDPPLILVSIHQQARIHGILREGSPFSVSFLTVDQTALTKVFAARDRPVGESAIRVMDGVPGENGVPQAGGSPGALECLVEHRVPVGDHVLLISRVVLARLRENGRPPQVFHHGLLTTVAGTARTELMRRSGMGDDTYRADCCIVGGGPAGLLLALLLARGGQTVVVVDKRERLDAGGSSYEPFLSPPSLELFDHLGMLGALIEQGQPVRQVQEHHADGGNYLLDYSSAPGCRHPYALSVPLMTLTGVVLDALVREPTVTILTGTSVLDLIEGENGNYGLGLSCDGARRTMECRYLVGSDGKFSRLREMADIEVEVFEFDHPLALIELPLLPNWPERITAHHDGQESLLATMPVAGGNLTVLWAANRGEHEAVRAAGVAELRSRVSAVVPELADLLADHLTGWDQVVTVHHHVVQPRTWFQGNLGLLGDSAHGMHSFGAQGLNMSVQDAVVLADVLTNPVVEDAPDAFASYEALRRPFVERFQRYQMSLRPLSSKPHPAERPGALYESISDVMTVGQPEVRPLYPRLATARRATSAQIA